MAPGWRLQQRSRRERRRDGRDGFDRGDVYFVAVAMVTVLIGAGLAVSGMTDPARVIGFLDVFGKWDPVLLFVMAGAVAVYGLGPPTRRCCCDVWERPGVSAAFARDLRSQIPAFVPAMAIGMLFAQKFFGADR